MGIISTVKQTKTSKSVDERMMKLGDVVKSLAQGTKPLGWLISLSMGGVKVPVQDAHNILKGAGIKNPEEWLKPIHPSNAFRSAIASFELVHEHHRQGKVFQVEKWEAEAVRKEFFLTYRRIDNDKGTEIEAHKIARIELDGDKMVAEILPTPLQDRVGPYVDALKHEFEERKIHYYRTHFYYMLQKMIAALGSVKWSDNSMYFVPRSRTEGLEQIETIIAALAPYKTTTHRTAMACVPIPDVEEIMGRVGGGYREQVEKKLEDSVKEQLDDLLDKLSEAWNRDNARSSTKVNRAIECHEQLEVITGVVEEYKEMLQSELRQVYAKIKFAKEQIKKMILD